MLASGANFAKPSYSKHSQLVQLLASSNIYADTRLLKTSQLP